MEIDVIAKLDLGGGKRGRRCWRSRREGGDEGGGRPKGWGRWLIFVAYDGRGNPLERRVSSGFVA